MAEFNKSLLIKVPGEVYIYDFIDSININKDRINHISQEFSQSRTTFGLPLSKLNLKIRAPIILFCNLYPVLKKYNGS